MALQGTDVILVGRSGRVYRIPAIEARSFFSSSAGTSPEGQVPTSEFNTDLAAIYRLQAD